MSIKDALLNRELPSIMYPFEIKDPTELTRQLSAAESTANDILRSGKKTTAKYKTAKRDMEAIAKAIESCFVKIKITSLPADEYDALIDAHPPTAEQKAEDGEGDTLWNEDTFRPALLAACTDEGMTADDWSAALKKMSKGERRSIWVAVLTLNESNRQPSLEAVGKGHAVTRL